MFFKNHLFIDFNQHYVVTRSKVTRHVVSDLQTPCVCNGNTPTNSVVVSTPASYVRRNGSEMRTSSR